MSPTISAKTAVPFVYRLILLTIEPFFAVMGSILVFRDPATYAGSTTRHLVSFTPDTKFLYTALGGSWLFFAFVEAVILRFFDEYVNLENWLQYLDRLKLPGSSFSVRMLIFKLHSLSLWRVLCLGMLLSDIPFMFSMAQGVGGWDHFFNLAEWTVEDWVATASTAPMVLTRIFIVLGIGLRTGGPARKND